MVVAFLPRFGDGAGADVSALFPTADEITDVIRIITHGPRFTCGIRHKAEVICPQHSSDSEILRATPAEVIVDHVKHQPVAGTHLHVHAFHGGSKDFIQQRTLAVLYAHAVLVGLHDKVIRHGDDVSGKKVL